jgi:hypothetical protein
VTKKKYIEKKGHDEEIDFAIDEQDRKNIG